MDNFSNAAGSELPRLIPLFDNLRELIVMVSSDGEIFYANPEFLHFSQMELDTLKAVPLPSILPEWTVVKDEICSRRHNEKVLQFCFKEKQDERQLILRDCFQWSDTFLLVFYQEGNQLTRSYDPAESWALLDSMEDMVVFVDLDYRIQAHNKAADMRSQVLFKKPIVKGSLIFDYMIIPEDNKIILQQYKIALSGQSTILERHYEIPNCEPIWHEYHSSPVMGINGKAAGVLIVCRDVSKTRRQELALNESESVFQNFFTNLQDSALLWHQDADGTIRLKYFNRSVEQMSAIEIKDWVGKSVDVLFKERPDVIERIRSCFLTGESSKEEVFSTLVTSGEPKWLLSETIRLSKHYVVNIIKDVSDRKRYEIEIEENQRQIRTLLSNLPGMAYRCANDPDWTMEFVSEGCKELLGYEPEDLINNQKISYGSIIHPDDRLKIWQSIQNAFASQRGFKLAYRIYSAKAELKWVWEKGQAIYNKNGEVVAVEGYITDISDRVQLEQTADRERHQAAALREAMSELSSELELAQVLRSILVILKKVIEYDSATLYLTENDLIRVAAARGFNDTSRLINRTFPATNPLLRMIQEHGEAIVLEDAQHDPRFERWEGADLVRSWMGVPLVRHGQFIGFLTIDSFSPGTYQTDDTLLAQTFADEAAIVIENARLYEKAQQLATEDSLTKVHNRRYFYELAQKELERSRRYHNPLSIIMLDIDHFKKVNDRYGHGVGDQVLIEFVKRVQKELRSSDIFARYGGEEFVILVVESDLEKAFQAAERIREKVNANPFEISGFEPIISISLGVAEMDENTQSLDLLMDCADKAMYEAKQSGRNRVCVWQKPV
jgi:diguanylate cyclase (GGDEF)-like protein/PAS domain S-box-containing protein